VQDSFLTDEFSEKENAVRYKGTLSSLKGNLLSVRVKYLLEEIEIPAVRTRRQYVGREYDYPHTFSLEFETSGSSELEEPVNGVLHIGLSEEFSYPVEISIDDDMVVGENEIATHVEFKNRHCEIEDSDKSYINFEFITKASSPRSGGKCYSLRTAEYSSEMGLTKENPEFIQHHVKMPSAQEVRLAHRILRDEGGEGTINELSEMYNENPGKAADKFSDDLVNYVSFEQRVKIQDFLIENTGVSRSYDDTANKVANQIIKEDFSHRTQSLEDVKGMISVVNKQNNLADTNIIDVLDKVAKRTDKTERKRILERLGIGDELEG
jgi:hypothetical protein